ncbi:MAG: amino acid:proton antiporter, partial [Clostridiales bacterium]
PKTEMPTGANLMNGIIATILVVVAPFLPSQDLFWSFFALNMITLLMSYVFIFPAFLKLRKIDPDKERPFKVSGGPGTLKLLTWVPLVLLVLSIIFSILPLNLSPEELSSKLPVLIGTIAAVIIGEIVVTVSTKNGEKQKNKQ